MTDLITCDICIIGAGAAGLSVAAGASQLGLDVVLIERGEMGGECLNVGCVPSKAILAAGKAAAHGRHAAVYGVTFDEPKVDYAAVMDHVRHAIDEIAPVDSQERYEGFGCTVIRETAKFVSHTELVAGDKRVQARKFIIATGSRPAVPPVPGLKDIDFLTNDNLWDLRELPEHLLVMGGGAIGIEMAQAHRRLGSKVTLVEIGPIMFRDDPEAVDVVRKQLIADGITLKESRKMVKVEKAEDGTITATLADGDGNEETITGSHLLVAAGRSPVTDTLDLDKAGVKYGPRGIEVDHALRTSNPRIHAAGDSIGGGFTHVAGHHAEILIKRLLFKMPAKVNTTAIPRVTYAEPELAQIGLTEKDAKEKLGDDLRVLRWPLAENDRAIAERLTDGFVKVLATKKGHVVGATIVGVGAGELLLPWSLAIRNKMKLAQVTGNVVAYPTRSEASKRAASSFFTEMLFSEKTRKMVRFLFRRVPWG